MRTPASIAGHPVHPMLITVPVGLFIFSLVCDLAALLSASGWLGGSMVYRHGVGVNAGPR